MLSLFKSNNPTVVLFYLFYLIAFRVYFWFAAVNTEQVFLHQEPLSSSLFGFLLRLPMQYVTLSLILSSLLCFVQALWVNSIVNSNKILPKKNFLAGAIFIVFASFFPQQLLLSPASLSLTFLIIATGKLFSIIRKEKANGDIYDIGFLVAIVALFYFPALLFILFAYIGLATVRAFSYREWIILLLGFLTPFLVVFTIYYWNDETSQLLPQIANVHSGTWLSGLYFSITEWMLVAALGLFTLISLILLPSALYSSNIQTRKFSLLLVLFVVLVPISFTLQQQASLTHLILMSLPLAIMISMLFIQLKRTWISEVIHLILILLVLAGQYLPLFKIIES